MNDAELVPSQFPDDPIERAALAERFAEAVRQLRLDREALPDGTGRSAQRKRIGLMIDVRRQNMHLLNPKKYKPVKS